MICRNEEKNIEECLRSVSWCNEIIVVDSFSTDETVKIARAFTDKIYENEWKGFAEQKRFAISKVNCEWVFSIDADERCTAELAKEIADILREANVSYNGFKIPRKSFFLNRWIKHGGWYPNYQLRLFRKNSATLSDRLVHESFLVDGNIPKLKSDLLHYTVTSVSAYISKINTYSDLSAREKFKKRKMGYVSLLLIPAVAFIRQYIFKGNILDGIGGLMVSRFHMITKTFNSMKIWEIQNSTDNQPK